MGPVWTSSRLLAAWALVGVACAGRDGAGPSERQHALLQRPDLVAEPRAEPDAEPDAERDAERDAELERSRPNNVIVLVLDDVGVELIGAYERWFDSQSKSSGRAAATPAIDQLLAARGIMFTNAWSNPSCSPTRAGLLTGRHAFRHGVGSVTGVRQAQGRSGLTSSAVLLPEVLRRAPVSYSSAALGKWHLADARQIAAEPTHPLGDPIGRWFDCWAGTYFVCGTPKGQQQRDLGYRSWKKSYASVVDRTINPCERGARTCSVHMLAPPIENYATVDTADDALASMRELREPYFLYVAFNACHKPWHDVPEGLPMPDCVELDSSAWRRSFPDMPQRAARARNMLAALDAQIGRVLCAIDESNTTVILLGDNGTAREASVPPHRARHAKGSLYQGGVRVPFIVRSPDIAPELIGSASAALIHTTDVFATVCEIAGSAATTSDSISFLPCLRDGTASPRALLYSEEFGPNFEPRGPEGGPPEGYSATSHEQALSDGRYKIIRRARRASEGEALRVREEFYDLVAGGPRDESSGHNAPDFFEQYELLSQGELDDAARAALERLRAELDSNYPSLVR